MKLILNFCRYEEKVNLLEKTLRKIKREGFLSTTISILRFPFTIEQRKAYKDMLAKGTINERFAEIYEKNLWMSKESGSGEGSEINYTKPLRKWLIKTLPLLNVKVFVDAPCGDFNWMKEVLPKINVKYFGFDITHSIIEFNKKIILQIQYILMSQTFAKTNYLIVT